MIDATGPASATPRAAAGPTVEPRKSGMLSSDFETFLRMLTAQIRNQDPLQPMASTEFATQLATFSSVEQQVRTNDLISELSRQLTLGGMAEFAGWVGMEARAAAPAYFDGTPVALYPAAAPGAARAELVIRDGNGREVGRQPAPVTGEPMLWAGRTATGGAQLAGLYSFELVAYDDEGQTSVVPVETYGKVYEARAANGGTVILREGGVEVAAEAVTGLRLPGPAS